MGGITFTTYDLDSLSDAVRSLNDDNAANFDGVVTVGISGRRKVDVPVSYDPKAKEHVANLANVTMHAGD